MAELGRTTQLTVGYACLSHVFLTIFEFLLLGKQFWKPGGNRLNARKLLLVKKSEITSLEEYEELRAAEGGGIQIYHLFVALHVLYFQK